MVDGTQHIANRVPAHIAVQHLQHNRTAHHAALHDRLSGNHSAGVAHLGPGMGDAEDERVSPLVAVLLIYGILFLMIGAQAALFLWKKKHRRSYELVTLVGLWLMPPIFCVQLRFWRFITVWGIYSIITASVVSQCMRKRMEHTTPRKVYSWFLGVHRVSTLVGFVGYVMLLGELLGLGPLLRLIFPMNFAMDLVWYGVYFGVLGRDCAEVASDRMAAVMGSGGRKLMNTANACGICGNELQDFSHLGPQAPKEEPVEKCVQLSCKHCFHELCVRGWTMVGKKDTCPVCMEKVDLRALYADRPWETRNLTWIQMLDSVRYLVVWNPIIFMVLSVLFHFFAPHHHGHPHDPTLHVNGTATAAAALGAGSPSPLAALGAGTFPPPPLHT